jgi:hypothetical protein
MADPIKQTEVSLELTDKIHRLVRRFSRDLVQLVAQEIGARAIKVKGKPGPKPGFRWPVRPCPLCGKNPNKARKFAHICSTCRGGKAIKVPSRKVTHGKYTGGYEVKVKVPSHLPLNPKPVDVDDVEPDFLDRIIDVIEAAPVEKAKPTTNDEDFW